MAQYVYTVVLHPDPDSGGYGVDVPALPGCSIQGTTPRRRSSWRTKRSAPTSRICSLTGGPVPEEREQPQLARVEVAT
jgi:hypothetical protein